MRAGRILLYLGTIAAFYLVVGLLFLWGLVNLVDVASDFLASPAGLIVRLVVGAALLITAFVMPTGGKNEKNAPAPAPQTASAPPVPLRGGTPGAQDANGSRLAPRMPRPRSRPILRLVPDASRGGGSGSSTRAPAAPQ